MNKSNIQWYSPSPRILDGLPDLEVEFSDKVRKEKSIQTCTSLEPRQMFNKKFHNYGL